MKGISVTRPLPPRGSVPIAGGPRQDAPSAQDGALEPVEARSPETPDGTASDQDRRPPQPHLEPRKAPVFNAPPVVLAVLALTAAVFLALHYGGRAVAAPLFEHLALLPIRFTTTGGPSYDWVATFASPLGHALLHADWMHLIVNMGLLLAFGAALARRAGAGGFLAVYILSILAGALAVVALSPQTTIPTIGASGGVSGIMGAICQMGFAQARGGPIAPAPFHRRGMALTYSLSFFAINLVMALFSSRLGIAWEAHVGGFLAGLARAPLFDHRQMALRRHGPGRYDGPTDPET